ncbi:sigma-70 family RNA polymerase sigma factor [candidate division KSB1 bacterium]|nr:sigma-70 family RNA polymerase sigma factor [candidate division KSB1 bacterium]
MKTAKSLPCNTQPSPDPDSLVRDYTTLVRALCRRMIRNPQYAADAEQQAWLEILSNLSAFRGESRISTWIYTIAARTIMRYARKETTYSIRFLRSYFHDESQPLAVPNRSERDLWVRQQCDLCLLGTLHCLDPDSRLAYILRDIAELDYADIARVLQCQETSVRQRVSRSRRKLYRFLTDECALFNRQGQCRCKMHKWVQEIDLPAEYERIRHTVQKARFFQQTGRFLEFETI